MEDTSLRYEDSALFRYYDKFRPRNVQEVVVGPSDEELSPISEWPPLRSLYTNLWINDRHKVEQAIRKAASQARQPDIFVGPLAYDEGVREFHRLCRVFDSVIRSGYQTELEDQPVDGYFLEREGDLRFILLSGNHRAAVLQVLGHRRISVQVRNRQPPVVSRSQLHRWTREYGGLYTTVTAGAIFDALWWGRGVDKVRLIGLL